MDRQNLGIRIGNIGQEARTAIGGCIRVPAEHGGPGRPVDLQRVMHQIAGNHGMLANVADTDTKLLPIHFPNPSVGRVESNGDRFRWRYMR